MKFCNSAQSSLDAQQHTQQDTHQALYYFQVHLITVRLLNYKLR